MIDEEAAEALLTSWDCDIQELNKEEKMAISEKSLDADRYPVQNHVTTRCFCLRMTVLVIGLFQFLGLRAPAQETNTRN